ncbi:hypothetical protein EGH24_01260 [Halonotius terrestris]|uniref:Uncharacterized protein n=1 Tax=Halonotius terrestris TaxID=2487750 RepID=A0A8J8PAR5_9EURY|nr:hypothetical protein [Halonotius terrestris]TQQ83452.1 hypothetical protein EGH24_01260 [Halonotius terrestris]
MAGRIRLVAASTGLFLLAVLALTVAVGPASAAIAADGSAATYQTTDADGELVDDRLSDNGVYWQGQRLALGNLSGDIANTTNRSDVSTLQLRRYDTDENELGELVRQIDIESGNRSLETDDLNGTYVLLAGDQREEVLEFENGRVNGTVDVESAAPFELLVQTLSAEWEASPPSAVGSDRQLEIQSNRLRYNLNVSSPDLNYTQLETAFMDTRRLRSQNGPFDDRRPFEQPYRMYDIYEVDGVIVLRGFSDGALQPDFSGFDRFPESIRVEVTDTGVTDRAVLSTGAVSGGPFNITEVTVSETVETGQEVTLAATIRNDWQEDDTREIVFQLGERRSTFETPIKSGESTRIATELTAPDSPGEVEYVVSTEGKEVRGTVTVVDPNPEQSSDSSGNETDSDNGIINIGINLQIGRTGMGGIMTALSLLTVILFRRR